MDKIFPKSFLNIWMKPKKFLLFKQLFLRRVQVSYRLFLICVSQHQYGRLDHWIVEITTTYSASILVLWIDKKKQGVRLLYFSFCKGVWKNFGWIIMYLATLILT